MKTLKPIATLALALVIFSAAQAQVFNAHNDKQKIKQGVRSGELTHKETVTLLKKENEIKKDRRLANADGVITCKERKEIKKDKLSADYAIYRKKHNGLVRN
ncbi:MAG: hypothetical protein IPL97_02465 [Niastella sp.]|nr:hypothetical protein [Niastella sp.]